MFDLKKQQQNKKHLWDNVLNMWNWLYYTEYWILSQ